MKVRPFTIAFLAGFINVVPLMINVKLNNLYLIPVNIGAMIICWFIAYKIYKTEYTLKKIKEKHNEWG